MLDVFFSLCFIFLDRAPHIGINNIYFKIYIEKLDNRVRIRREKSRIAGTVQYCTMQYLLKYRSSCGIIFVPDGDCCWLLGRGHEQKKVIF